MKRWSMVAAADEAIGQRWKGKKGAGAVNARRRAIISVYDKTGVVELARALKDRHQFEILSTGQTAEQLQRGGVETLTVEEVTGFPEVLDGRVKSLHPRIFAGILADRDNAEHVGRAAELGVSLIDVVVVNFYPLDASIARGDSFDAIVDMIDIGGPCLVRAAAKNHRHVWVVHDPHQYGELLQGLSNSDGLLQWDMRKRLARAAFLRTHRYDASAAQWLGNEVGAADLALPVGRERIAALRYGENPHQRAELWSVAGEPRWIEERFVEPQAPAMSYNNWLDSSAAFGLAAELAAEFPGQASSVLVKHNTPCGVGLADGAVESYGKAYRGDPSAAMGSVLATTAEVDEELATVVMASLERWGRASGAGGFFIEGWVSPRFTAEAVAAIRTLKPWGRRVRLMECRLDRAGMPKTEVRMTAAGLLCQSADAERLDEEDWGVTTLRRPGAEEMRDAKLAWLICKHVRSNAISLCRDGMLLGSCGGQTSRVMSCKVAVQSARECGHADGLVGCAAGSDGFFPFADGAVVLMDAGAKTLVQPGGAKRDEEITAECDARGVAMIFTGRRHFRH